MTIGIIGLGNIGQLHARTLHAMTGITLTAYDRDSDRAKAFGTSFGMPIHGSIDALLDAVDAVIVTTPHTAHAEPAIAALERGVHTLVEKPIASRVSDAHRMMDAWTVGAAMYPGLVFSVMLQERLNPMYIALKKMIDASAVGRIVRASWTMTDWFRTQRYYDSASWRGTWRGEGGGVLINQCVHNLDIYQWLFGMPSRVAAFASFGKYHDIETEDEVTAYFEYENGMIGHLYTSTAESPGVNRLEVIGENGTITCENGELTKAMNDRSMLAVIRDAEEVFVRIPYTKEHHRFPEHSPRHEEIISSFITAIRSGGTPAVSGADSVASIELVNALTMSALTHRMVDMPLDASGYDGILDGIIRMETKEKKVIRSGIPDLSASFAK